MNLYQSFATVAQRNQERTAIIDGEQRISYGELLRRVEGMGAVAAASTQKRAVGVYLPTSGAFVAAIYGLWRAGFTAVPLNLLAPPSDLAYVARDAELDTIITSEKLAANLGETGARLVQMEDLMRAAAAGQPPPLQALEGRPTPSGDELALLLYTSGTMGHPKGVRLSHANVRSNIEACLSLFEVTPDDVILGILPLFHTFALTATMGISMHSGATFVTQMRFNPEAALDAVGEHGVSILIAVPSMHRVLAAMQRGKQVDTSKLRFGVAGGEPLPPKILRDFEEVFNAPLLQGYGLTESSPVVSINPPDANRPGSVGRPLPGVTVRIVNEDASAVPAGEVGEIIVQGPNVMQGYNNLPDETALMVRDGWLWTGDMGMLSEDGYLTITGRRKEMIIVGGMNVFPAEVEALLSEHPAVEHCAVLGVGDERHGEQVKAIVVPRDRSTFGEGGMSDASGTARRESAAGSAVFETLEAELREWLRERLAQYKVPRQWEFRDEVPLGPTGKVLKKAL